MSDGLDADYVAERFVALVREAYLLEKGERTAELEGRRLPYRDASGLNPVSYVTGQYRELFMFVMDKLGLPCNPAIETLLPHQFDIRREARADAELEHTHKLVHEAFEEHARAEEARTPGLAEARAAAALEPPVF